MITTPFGIKFAYGIIPEYMFASHDKTPTVELMYDIFALRTGAGQRDVVSDSPGWGGDAAVPSEYP
jgi:hypothetical protein